MPNEHHIALKKRVNDNESPICSVIPSGVEESRFAAKEDSFPIASGLGMTHGLKTGTGTLPGHLPLPQREVSPQGRHDMAGGFEPLRNTLYKVGATYTWSDLTLTPSEAGKQELLKKLQDTISVPFEVVKHEAGIRPTTKQRRPFLGRHPEVQQLAVFNGLGTKGASLGPWFASEMCEHLISGKVLNEKVACSKLHFPTGQVRL